MTRTWEQRRAKILKVSSKLIFLLIIIAAGLAILYSTTTSPQRASGWEHIQGLLAYKFKDYPGAMNNFTRAHSKDPNNLTAFYFMLRSKVMIWEESKRKQVDQHFLREAASESNALIEQGKDSQHKNLYLFYYLKALAHHDLKEYDAAAKAIEKGMDVKPDDYNVLILAGRIMINRGDYRRAVIYLKQAAELKTFKAYEAYFYLGLAYEWIGDSSNAYYYYDQCIKSWPPRDIKQEALRRKTNLVAKPSSG
jgi:tetratricopeptide (TPR) repeat protein